MTIHLDYGAPPFTDAGRWDECTIDGRRIDRQELPLAGFFDAESSDWYVVCDDCAGCDSATIRRRLEHYAESLGPDDGRAPWLRRLAEHDWALRTPGPAAQGTWVICSSGHWFPRPARPDQVGQVSFTDSGTGQRAEQAIQLARCPQCARWVVLPELV
jgi:hypothetical protein